MAPPLGRPRVGAAQEEGEGTKALALCSLRHQTALAPDSLAAVPRKAPARATQPEAVVAAMPSHRQRWRGLVRPATGRTQTPPRQLPRPQQAVKPAWPLPPLPL